MKSSIAIVSLFTAVLSASAFSLFGPKPGGPGREPPPKGKARVMEVKIGAVLPLSGVVASDGEAALHGRLALFDLLRGGRLREREWARKRLEAAL